MWLQFPFPCQTIHTPYPNYNQPQVCKSYLLCLSILLSLKYITICLSPSVVGRCFVKYSSNLTSLAAYVFHREFPFYQLFQTHANKSKFLTLHTPLSPVSKKCLLQNSQHHLLVTEFVIELIIFIQVHVSYVRIYQFNPLAENKLDRAANHAIRVSLSVEQAAKNKVSRSYRSLYFLLFLLLLMF